MTTPPKTGWPQPALAQDDLRGLFRWFASKPDARRRVRESAGSCCDQHAETLPHGCNQGRACPERTRRVQEHELRWTDELRQCAASGQMSAAQIAAHARAGEFAMGDASADPAHRAPVQVAPEPLPVSFAGPEPSEPTWPFVLVTAVVACVTLGLIAAYLMTNWHALELLINT